MAARRDPFLPPATGGLAGCAGCVAGTNIVSISTTRRRDFSVPHARSSNFREGASSPVTNLTDLCNAVLTRKRRSFGSSPRHSSRRSQCQAAQGGDSEPRRASTNFRCLSVCRRELGTGQLGEDFGRKPMRQQLHFGAAFRRLHEQGERTSPVGAKLEIGLGHGGARLFDPIVNVAGRNYMRLDPALS